jgi:ATP-dependent DNA helicase RecQ
MGLDHPDVEAVIHADPGRRLAYPEIGRAGRDGCPATVTLLGTYADVKTPGFLTDHAPTEDARPWQFQ